MKLATELHKKGSVYVMDEPTTGLHLSDIGMLTGINDRLVDAQGKLLDGMMNPDKLHPSVQAYQIWADALKPVFTELLGPPAVEDRAPAPTGDPSALRPM